MKIITNKRNFKHGLSATTEYKTWSEIKRRCSDNKRYGAKGITVCERWHKFENFYADMGKRPSNEHSIERVNNKGNYEPENCKWATRKEQANNRSSSHLVEIDGVIKTIQQWCDLYGIPDTTFHNRLKRGLTGEQLRTGHRIN